MRKIVHIDMDAFYASVAQLDDPSLRGAPLIVAWPGRRSVVLAASYPARAFGVRSAMPVGRAQRLCSQAVRVAPDFARYREVSRAVRSILARFSRIIEPLSLDEAYLDVTENLAGSGPASQFRLSSATAVAQAIRQDIRQELQLTASAGVGPNKLLAKIASDWNKPDGLFVIRPQHARHLLAGLPVTRLPGVGPATARRLADLGVRRIAQLQVWDPDRLQARFGRFGMRLWEMAQGIDERPVGAEPLRLSVSAETTLERDLPLAALGASIAELAALVWRRYQGVGWTARTVVLKLKTADFRVLTRSVTQTFPPQDAAALADYANRLRLRVGLPDATRYRLVGVGLVRGVRQLPAQPILFAD
ncbi:MAG: DNA polymerase IV [Gammaproteobacteria bacterium]|nr:DNA polymerase IV [Gammaproteobacteria bacterium]